MPLKSSSAKAMHDARQSAVQIDEQAKAAHAAADAKYQEFAGELDEGRPVLNPFSGNTLFQKINGVVYEVPFDKPVDG